MRQTATGFENVGSRIRSVRESKGISMKKFSAMLECNYKYLGDIELGNENPSLEMLMKISNLLDKSVDYFVMDHPLAYPNYIIDAVLSEKLHQCNAQTLVAIESIVDSLITLQGGPVTKK